MSATEESDWPSIELLLHSQDEGAANILTTHLLTAYARKLRVEKRMLDLSPSYPLIPQVGLTRLTLVLLSSDLLAHSHFDAAINKLLQQPVPHSLIPINVRPHPSRAGSALNDLVALPCASNEPKFLSQWTNQDAAYTHVVEKISEQQLPRSQARPIVLAGQGPRQVAPPPDPAVTAAHSMVRDLRQRLQDEHRIKQFISDCFDEGPRLLDMGGDPLELLCNQGPPHAAIQRCLEEWFALQRRLDATQPR